MVVVVCVVYLMVGCWLVGVCVLFACWLHDVCLHVVCLLLSVVCGWCMLVVGC